MTNRSMEYEEQAEQPALPIDIQTSIFHNLLEDSRFQAWKDIHRHWQLHISGGPGSGKVSSTNDLCIRAKEKPVLALLTDRS